MSEVDEWMASYDNPMRPVVEAIRQVLLSDDRITETIKWKSPTFMYKGNLASFNPRSKSHASLMFHTGATIPGEHSLLEGGGDTARYARFETLEAVEANTDQLLAIVDAWCASRDD